MWDGSAPTDAVGVRFRFYVADNVSESLKLIFGASRLYGPGSDTYLMEYNVYDRGLRYDDWVSTTWPLQGTYTNQEASLRVAVPDYIQKGKTGVRSFDTEMFPRQTYEIDGIDGLWKTDLISQANLNQVEGSVMVTRGDIIADLSGWRADGTDLPLDTYRQWDVAVSLGEQTYNMAFAFPDENARWLAPWEPLNFYSEFLHTEGLFRVNYWDFGIKREGIDAWDSINTWRVTHHDGSLDDFGVIRSSHAGVPVIEFSNDPELSYLPVDSIIDISPVPEAGTLYLFVTGALVMLGSAAGRKLRQRNDRHFG
jgi:hypothetical protein